MKLRLFVRLAGAFGTVGLLAAGAPRPSASPVRDGVQGSLPAELVQLLAKGQAAIAAKDGTAIRSLALAKDSVKWMPSLLTGPNTKWKLAIMSLPAPIPILGPNPAATSPEPTRFLAIFYTYHTVQSIGDHFHRLVKTKDGWRIGEEIAESETLGYRVRDHHLKLMPDTKSSTCAITDSVDIERTAQGGSDVCLLRLSSVLNLDSAALVTADGKAATAAESAIHYKAGPGCIAVAAPGRQFTIALRYHGTYSDPNNDSYITPKELSLSSYWWPAIARQPASHSVTIRVPSGWTAVAEGEPVGRSEGSNSVTYSFRNAIPVCYFTVDAAPYVITTRQIAGRRISTYLLKANPERAKRALDQFEKALPFFEKAFGPFPYTHYELVETAGPFGGALEGYSFATYGPGSFGAVVHELAHTWWGGLVPNTYLKSLWNESFADYSDELESRMVGGSEAAPALRGQHRAPDYGRRTLGAYRVPMAAAFDTSNGAHASVGYGKGAQVLAMFEDLIGREKMLRCMRRFMANRNGADSAIREQGADWPDFERAVSEETGEDYGWFFKEWVGRGGIPVVGLSDVKQTGGEITFDLNQESPAYRLRIPITILLQSGAAIKRTVEVQSATESIRIPVPSAAKRVTVDPDGTLLIAAPAAADTASDPFVRDVSN